MADFSYTPYIGSGPYCYASSLAMVLGQNAPPVSVIEFASGSPFGMQFINRSQLYFDPYGWTPLLGIQNALEAMGWHGTLVNGENWDDSLACLKKEVQKGPVLIGPVDMGYLRHQPGSDSLCGADHYLIVLRVEDDLVELHDPQGYPHASLPLSDFQAAWKAEGVEYGSQYTMLTGLRRLDVRSEQEIIKRTIPRAIKLLSMEGQDGMPAQSAGNGEAAMRLADIVEASYGKDFHDLRSHLIHFAVRVGARRMADAAACLFRIGYSKSARIVADQARLVGSLQHPLVIGENSLAASILRALAPTYKQLEMTLEKGQ